MSLPHGSVHDSTLSISVGGLSKATVKKRTFPCERAISTAHCPLQFLCKVQDHWMRPKCCFDRREEPWFFQSSFSNLVEAAQLLLEYVLFMVSVEVCHTMDNEHQTLHERQPWQITRLVFKELQEVAFREFHFHITGAGDHSVLCCFLALEQSFSSFRPLLLIQLSKTTAADFFCAPLERRSDLRDIIRFHRYDLNAIIHIVKCLRTFLEFFIVRCFGILIERHWRWCVELQWSTKVLGDVVDGMFLPLTWCQLTLMCSVTAPCYGVVVVPDIRTKDESLASQLKFQIPFFVHRSSTFPIIVNSKPLRLSRRDQRLGSCNVTLEFARTS
mmetsp:Transcript_45397/g.72461  ORF Transcript_45397/g.72461 Transcript_45397/m.72461 type:complete len:329 (+) Transcript_45397:1026-2012(+)